jgi:hypothetical protein
MISDKWFQFRTTFMEQSGIFNYLKAVVKSYVEYMDQNLTEETIADWAKKAGAIIIGVFEKVVTAAAYAWEAVRAGKVGFDVLTEAAIKLAWVVDLAVDVTEKLYKIPEAITAMVGWLADIIEKVANFMPAFLQPAAMETAIKLQGVVKEWNIEMRDSGRHIAAWRAGMADLRKDSVALMEGLTKLLTQKPGRLVV